MDDLGSLLLETWIESVLAIQEPAFGPPGVEKQLGVEEAGALYTGGAPWKAGLDLARHLPAMANLEFPGHRILELGSGTGVAGLAAAACGAHVVLSDLPAATALLERNVELNRHVFQSRGSASVKTLDYREALIDPYWHDFDLVLGTDLVWLKDQCLPVAQWCKACGAPIFLVSVPRWPWLKDGLLASFRAVGMIPHALNNGLLPGLVALLFLPAGRCPGDSVPWIAAHWDELGPDHEGVPELTEKARRTCAPACLRFRSTSQARMS
eukprot:s428_g11.t1